MRRLLTPKWLAWHAFALVATYAMIRLGLWQWHRAHATHSAQNMGYALQWPAFAIFGLAVWWRVCRDVLHPPEDKAPPAEKPTRRAPEPAAAVTPVTDEEDPELAAYNRYLARLNQQ
ncbi:MAG TPA: transcriptional regulator [Mycobacteriales bacterium]|nr:transcriptional regulator [Mycobacteriales bacterium]